MSIIYICVIEHGRITYQFTHTKVNCSSA